MQRICSLADLVPGEGLRVDTVRPAIAVFRTDDGTVHVVDDTCTHQDASLAAGWVEGDQVECPLHASCFSLRTGAADQPPATKPIRVHHAEIRDGDVYVELSSEIPHLPPGVSL